MFAETWHSDWSFKEDPPIGTMLYGITIPPVGGHTSFSNQQAALAQMPSETRAKLEGLKVWHSAATAYAPDGFYGDAAREADRSMKIVISDEAHERRLHPLIQTHPESGRQTLFSTFGYICGVEGMAQEAAQALLLELYEWQIRAEFRYEHHWQPGMLVLWEPLCVAPR